MAKMPQATKPMRPPLIPERVRQIEEKALEKLRKSRRARQMAAWQRLVGELVPVAAGSQLLAVQPPALVVSAAGPLAAQELRLRSSELLRAFAGVPDGERLSELRVAIRPPGPAGSPGGASGADGPRRGRV